ncbi:MAG: enoyl-[acyl-carrier protein] reductase I, partial [Paracoccaceae bacterium]
MGWAPLLFHYTPGRSGVDARPALVYTTGLNASHKGALGMTGLMAGKRGLIMGVANDKSIAWAIAKACADQGAEIAFTYQGEALKKRVGPLAASIGADILLPCDVTDEASMDAVFAEIEAKWGKLDFLVHAIGFSDKAELRGRYVDTSAKNFEVTMNISVYSFTAVAQRAEKLMGQGGSMVTLTYYG